MKSWIGFLYFSHFNNNSTIKTSQIEAFRNTLYSSKTFWRVLEKIGKNEGGGEFFQPVPMLKNENKIFFGFP